PTAFGIWMQRLHPIKRCGGVRQFAGSMIKSTLAASDASEVEAQRGETPLLEHIEKIVDDLVVHGPAELRVRVQDERDRRVLFFRRLIPAFETTGRTVKDDLGHFYSTSVPPKTWSTLTRS